MQVTYQQTLEDWVGGMIFGIEQSTSPKQYDKRRLGYLIFFFAAFDILILVRRGASLSFWLYTAIIVVWIGYRGFQMVSKRRTLYKRLIASFGDEYEKEDNTNYWDISADIIVVGDRQREHRHRWEGIRKIIISPKYLLVDFGIIGGYGWMPRRAISEAEYKAFCEEMIRLYREHAARQGKIAEVVHSDWKIDIDRLRRKPFFKEAVCR